MAAGGVAKVGADFAAFAVRGERLAEVARLAVAVRLADLVVAVRPAAFAVPVRRDDLAGDALRVAVALVPVTAALAVAAAVLVLVVLVRVGSAEVAAERDFAVFAAREVVRVDEVAMPIV